MAKIVNSKTESKPTKFERVYEDDDSISIWKYDLDKQPYGPISTEIKYKRGYKHPSMNQKKFLKDFVNEEKKNSTKK
jgi:hypothetical protein